MVKEAYIAGFMSELHRHGLVKSAGPLSLLAPVLSGAGKLLTKAPKVVTKPLSWYFKGAGRIITGGPVKNKLLNRFGITALKPHPIIGGLAAVSPFVGGAMWLRNRNEKLQQVDTMTPIQEARWQRKTKGGYYDLGYDLEDSNDIPSLAY